MIAFVLITALKPIVIPYAQAIKMLLKMNAMKNNHLWEILINAELNN
jgi:hypothetical protein